MKNWKFRIAYLLAVLIGLGLIYSVTSPSMQIPLTLSDSQMAALVGSSHENYAQCKTIWKCEEQNKCYNMGTWSYYPHDRENGKDCEYNASKWCELSDAKVTTCYIQTYENSTDCTGDYRSEYYNYAEYCNDGNL